MFAFLPPVKAARTERSPSSCVDVPSRLSQLVTPEITTASAHTSALVAGKTRPSCIAEAEIHVGGIVVRPSAFLTGIGIDSCWMVDEDTRLLRVWNMRKPFWQRTAPRVATIPSFTEDEGLPLFVCEMGTGEESLVFCTDYGAVSSLDHSAEFQFSGDGEPVSVSAFACKRDGDALFTAVGTKSGLVLVAIKVDGERYVVDFDRAECRADVRTSLSSSLLGSWWRSLVPGLSTSNDSRGSSLEESYGKSSVNSTNGEFTLLRFRAQCATQIWATNSASEILLLDFGPVHRKNRSKYKATAIWITNVSAMLQRQGLIVAFDESITSVCCLVYVLPRNQSEASLEVVTMDVNNGAVRQKVSIQSIGLLVHTIASAPLHHTKLYIDDTHETVTILSGQCCVRVNNRVGVRSPCSSNDVHILRGVETPIVSSLLPDGRIVTMDVSGPIVSAVTADELLGDSAALSAGASADANAGSGDNERKRQVHNLWQQSRFAGKREGVTSMAQLLNNLLDALRVDNKMSLDAAVLDASEAICLYSTPHEGNWARADLNVEDENVIMHVTHNLVQRQQEHRRFLLTVLLHSEVESRLRPQTIASLISTQEALLAMVAIRRLQNDISYPLPTDFTTTMESFEVVTPLYRLTSSCEAGLDASEPHSGVSVEQYCRLARSAVERERCQKLLRDAITVLADQVRNELAPTQSFYKHATAAEITFGDPSRLSALLRILGEQFYEAQRSVLVDPRTKFDLAIALASIFVIVTRAVDESREDIAGLYSISHSVRAQLWTSSDAEKYGIQVQLSNASVSLSGALADAVAAKSTALTLSRAGTSSMVSGCSHALGPTGCSTWGVPLQDQLHLLDLIALITHFSFRNHSQGGSAFYSNAMRRTLFCEPFLREPLGYPFGPPVPSADATLGAAVLHVCEELALEFIVDEVLGAVCLAETVEDPLREGERYGKLKAYCERNPKMYEIALRILLSQNREWELQLLPDLVPNYESAVVVRDAFLAAHAPQLAWLAKPAAYQSIIQEGMCASAPFTYGEDLITHRSRCLSMAKLAWLANGARQNSTLYSLELDAQVVAAQRAFLIPDTKDVILGPAELIQRLLKLPCPDAWVSAAGVACRVEEDLRGDLLTQIVRRAKEYDGEALQHIRMNGASEREISQALEKTAIGRIVLETQQCGMSYTSDVTRVSEEVLEKSEQQLLLSWLQARAGGMVGT
ncbi:hypothetical protein ERJ75_000240200 [Trypanosoma vivax]|nr:hypothetical protein ERJ75_000240200 [Trypanosoma vivax]